ncbi:hypothetical protein IKG_05224, partial [Bacillus cereus VD200]
MRRAGHWNWIISKSGSGSFRMGGG